MLIVLLLALINTPACAQTGGTHMVTIPMHSVPNTVRLIRQKFPHIPAEPLIINMHQLADTRIMSIDHVVTVIGQPPAIGLYQETDGAALHAIQFSPRRSASWTTLDQSMRQLLWTLLSDYTAASIKSVKIGTPRAIPFLQSDGTLGMYQHLTKFFDGNAGKLPAVEPLLSFEISPNAAKVRFYRTLLDVMEEYAIRQYARNTSGDKWSLEQSREKNGTVIAYYLYITEGRCLFSFNSNVDIPPALREAARQHNAEIYKLRSSRLQKARRPLLAGRILESAVPIEPIDEALPGGPHRNRW